MIEKIDFVIAWLDDTDPVWQKSLHTYLPQSHCTDDTSIIRFRNWDNLHYWFRGVEKFAPWVNKVHLITCGQTPEWLNLDAPKLHLVKHSDYIPAENLPTFNSCAIQLGLHRIEGLSEHFVCFDDDFFLIDKVGPERFFRKGLPCDLAAFKALYPQTDFIHIPVNNLCVINNSFNKRELLRKNCRKWLSAQSGKRLLRSLLLLPWAHFTGFYDHHFPLSCLKSTLEEVWERHPDIMCRTTASRFRSISDVSNWLFRYWQLAKGDFAPLNVYKDSEYFQLFDHTLDDAVRTIELQKKKIICLNDGEVSDFEVAKNRINAAFEKILPDKSSFEK